MIKSLNTEDTLENAGLTEEEQLLFSNAQDGVVVTGVSNDFDDLHCGRLYR